LWDVYLKVFKKLGFYGESNYLVCRGYTGFEVTHNEDMNKMIKLWLVYIEILEPLRLKEKLMIELQECIWRVI